MNRWLVTVLIERAQRRGFPRVHRFDFDVRWPAIALFAIGGWIGWMLR